MDIKKVYIYLWKQKRKAMTITFQGSSHVQEHQIEVTFYHDEIDAVYLIANDGRRRRINYESMKDAWDFTYQVYEELDNQEYDFESYQE